MQANSVGAMIPARDLERAIAWYRDALGLTPESRYHDHGATYVMPGGGSFFLYQTPHAGTAEHTLISFDTPDIEADMASLRAAGVTFLDYPEMGTVDGLMDTDEVRNAWFKDSEGNIIGLVQGM